MGITKNILIIAIFSLSIFITTNANPVSATQTDIVNPGFEDWTSGPDTDWWIETRGYSGRYGPSGDDDKSPWYIQSVKHSGNWAATIMAPRTTGMARISSQPLDIPLDECPVVDFWMGEGGSNGISGIMTWTGLRVIITNSYGPNSAIVYATQMGPLIPEGRVVSYIDNINTYYHKVNLDQLNTLYNFQIDVKSVFDQNFGIHDNSYISEIELVGKGEIQFEQQSWMIIDDVTVYPGFDHYFSGQMLNYNTYHPIEGIKIEILENDVYPIKSIASSITDSNGYFQIPIYAWMLNKLDSLSFNITHNGYSLKEKGYEYYLPTDVLIYPGFYTFRVTPNNNWVLTGNIINNQTKEPVYLQPYLSRIYLLNWYISTSGYISSYIQEIKLFNLPFELGTYVDSYTDHIELRVEDYSGNYEHRTVIYDATPGAYTDDIYINPITAVHWKSPGANSEVDFGPGEDILFNFSYSTTTSVDQVKLYINDTLYGSFPGSTTILHEQVNLRPYTSQINGLVKAELRAYSSGSYFYTAERYFTFRYKVSDAIILLESNTSFIGQELYLILHDPQGDNSFTSVEQTTSYKNKFEITGVIGGEASWEYTAKEGLFGIGAEASQKFTLSIDASQTNTFISTVTDTSGFTSSKTSDDPDYIGPGRGDRYWGESWVLQYEIYARNITWWNPSGNTVEYSQPSLKYGIVRDAEVFLSDANAPMEWKAQNANYNDSIGVDWLQFGKIVDGGAEYTSSHTQTHTQEVAREIDIDVSSETSAKLKLPIIGGGTGTLKLHLGAKFNWDDEVTQAYTRTYTLFDDENSDMLSQDVGIDTVFGTYIFKANKTVESKTSNPWEFDTLDYIAPSVSLPTIDYDSDGDGLGPSSLDTPIITTQIYEESGIQEAIVVYSVDNGVSWMSTFLTEQIANSGSFTAHIPAQTHNKTVLWYIQVTDNAGLVTVRKDANNNYFSYVVINLSPTMTNLYPNGGEILSGIINISWYASDPDGDSLTYSIAYNIANTGWQLLSNNTTNTIFSWDTTQIPNSTTVLLKITATDEFGGSITKESNYTFEINN